MKKILMLSICSGALFVAANAQTKTTTKTTTTKVPVKTTTTKKTTTILNKIGAVVPQVAPVLTKITSVTTTTSLTNDDIINGLKEALRVGTDSASKKLGQANGFFSDAAVKILMPDEVKKVETSLRTVGM
ncbi:MAG: DUF4197 family protein, partial [Sphingobacteriales bacterium]|nr:DUF4197 family protein [Sphingobacteriales bacterium]